MKTTTDIQISHLRASLNGKVIGADDPGYDDARRVVFTGFDRRPAAIVRAADASDVARVVTLARETGAELAVRSGGHSRAGHGTSEGGIVLDLSAMNAVEIDADGRTAWAQTGVTAGDYTTATGEHGLATGLGDTASVGLGGITLGGGIGFLVRRNGLTIDDLLAAEVVTADGELLEVDEETHADLFWALRGGGGNFGVATRLRLRLHEIDEVVGGMLMLPGERRRDHRAGRRGGRGPGGALGDREHPEGAAAALHPRGAARQAGGDRPDGLRGRCRGRREGDRADPRASRPRSPTWCGRSATRRCTQGRKAHPRRSTRGRTSSSTSCPRERAETILEHLETATAAMAAVQLRVLGGAMARVPDDATAFGHRGAKLMVNIAAMHERPEERPEHESLGGRPGERRSPMEPRPRPTSGSSATRGTKALRRAYPPATLERLARVKRRYDPDNLFRLNLNVPAGHGT